MSDLAPAPVLRRPADFGPAGDWVARHGLPVGGALLDAGGPVEDIGRYAFLGLAPSRVTSFSLGDADLAPSADPFQALAELVGPPVANSGGPAPRVICALAYDLGRLVESVPNVARAEGHLPDLWAARYPAVYVWDRASVRGELVGETESALDAAQDRLAAGGATPAPFPVGPAALEMAYPEYQTALARILERIRAGDTYQINYTARLRAPRRSTPDADPTAFFTRLHACSPAPFACFLRLDAQRAVMGISPERFLCFTPDGHVETRPIKGTRPRGATAAEDERLAAALLAAEKDAAEHVMIVDLERNDLGRVCRAGSVRVTGFRTVERHPTVHHLVSTVSGELRPGTTLPDLLRATFPGGSITGAPKIRAMGIIDHLEPVRRGLYCGAVGHLDADGGGDLNIAIRTAYTTADALYYQAGGGIVADSDPQAEWAELRTKAAAFIRACEAGPGPNRGQSLLDLSARQAPPPTSSSS